MPKFLNFLSSENLIVSILIYTDAKISEFPTNERDLGGKEKKSLTVLLALSIDSAAFKGWGKSLQHSLQHPLDLVERC